MKSLNAERDAQIAELLASALSEFQQHGRIDVAAWQKRYPVYAEDLPELLRTLCSVETAADDCREILAETRDGMQSWATFAESVTPGGKSLPERIGRYRILAELGEGGMGTVYKAEDPQLQRLVAIKVPRFQGPARGRELAQQRFMREARAAARIRHPHVCPLYDVGEQDGVPYVVMAYVEGESLAERLARQGRLEGREAAELARQVAEALAAVHRHDIVHRDLKPGNVLLDANGQALLTDFGLARCQQDAESLTADGALLGTAAYMAPEQAALEPDKVGPWTDLYGLGVVLYRMVAGKPPFTGDVLTVIHRISREVPPPPSKWCANLDPALEAIIQKAMARDPQDRYADAAAFAQALAGWINGETRTLPVEKRRPAATSPQPTRRHRWIKVAIRSRWLQGISVVVLASLLVMPQIIIRIRDRNGRVNEIEVPEGADVSIKGPGGDKLFHMNKTNPAPPGLPKETATVLGDPSWRFWVAALSGCSWFHGEGPPLSFTPDGKGLRLTTNDGIMLRIWDAPTGTLRLAFGHDRSQLMSSEDGSIVGVLGRISPEEWQWTLWDVHPGKEHLRLYVAGKRPSGLAISPDRKWLAAEGDKKIRLWDAATRKELPSLDDPSGAFAFSPDSKFLAVMSDGKGFPVTLWDVSTRKQHARFEIAVPAEVRGQLHHWVAPVFSPDGRYLAVRGFRHGDSCCLASVVEPATGKETPIPEANALVNLAFAPDGKALACAYSAGLVLSSEERPVLRLFDWPSGKERFSIQAHRTVGSVAFSPDGKRLAAASADGIVRLYDPATGKQVDGAPEEADQTSVLALSQDGKTLATLRGYRAVQLWDVKSGTARLTVELASRKETFQVLALSPDGKSLAAVVGRSVRVWDVESKEGRTLDVQNQHPTALAFSSDGKLLAVGDFGGVVRLWDTATWKALKSWNGHTSWVSTLAFSPDARMLASVGHDRAIKLWEPLEGQEIRSLTPADKPLPVDGTLAFSPDGKYLAGHWEGTPLAVWETATGQQVHVFTGIGVSGGMGFGADSKTLYVSAGLGRILQLDCEQKKTVQEWQLPGTVHALKAASDGQLILGNGNGTVTLFRPPASK